MASSRTVKYRLFAALLLLTCFTQSPHAQRVPLSLEFDRVILNAKLSNDGSLVAISEEGVPSLWNAKTGEKIFDKLFPSLGWPVGSLAFSPDGNILAGGNNDGAYIWDTKTGAILKVINVPAVDIQRYETAMQVEGLDITPDGKILAAIRKGTVSLWNLETYEKISQSERLYYVDGSLFDFNEIFMLLNDRENTIGSFDGNSAAIFNIKTGKYGDTVPRFEALGISVSPDRKYLLAWPNLIDLDTLETVRTFQGIEAPEKSALSNNARWMYTSTLSTKGTFSLNELKEKNVTERIAQFDQVGGNPIKGISFIRTSADGKTVLTASGNTVNIWDMSDLTSHVPGAATEYKQ